MARPTLTVRSALLNGRHHSNFLRLCTDSKYSSAIPPGETLTYNIPTDLQSGTYWIHGHYDGQYVDGLRTPFVIKPLVHEPYTWDGDYTVVVADWYNQLHKPLKDYFLNIYSTCQVNAVLSDWIDFLIKIIFRRPNWC